MRKILAVIFALLIVGIGAFVVLKYHDLFGAAPEEAAPAEEVDDGELKPEVKRDEMALVDPPIFTVSIIKPKRPRRLLSVAFRIVAAPDKATELRRRISLIQDVVNRELYSYVATSDEVDYREIRRRVALALRRSFGDDAVLGVLYHNAYIR
ncbi:hypothetical protein FACS1894186_7570 [Alphaproteobacteria bacterium]|nr:hypothetical protein FACS1894186_7570 [Alphaproteobacteria bacterium]